MASFEKDLFISYAHIDNQPPTPEQKGWISRFHATLEALLSMRLGQAAKIWRDDKLQGNEVFADEIVDQFTHTAVLVSVLTPRYLNLDWCGGGSVASRDRRNQRAREQAGADRHHLAGQRSARRRGDCGLIHVQRRPEPHTQSAATGCP